MDLLLEKLLKAFSTSGNEEGIRNAIKNELSNLSVKYEEDKMGNLIIKFSNNNFIDGNKINSIDDSGRVMICTHMDSIGFITTFIDDKGFIRVAPIGTFNINKVLNSNLIFKNGAIGKLCSLKDNSSFEDVFVDIGVNSKEEAMKYVKEGDAAIVKSKFIEKDDIIISPGLNNKIGCYVLLEIIKKMKKLKDIKVNKDLYIVFSTQGELEGRGARAVTNLIKPDYSIVLDVEEENKSGFNLGSGCAIKVLDKKLIIHHEIKELLEKIFEKLNIKTKYLVSDNSTEGGAIHKECNGSKTGVLSIPCRYKNSSQEFVNKNDIKEAISIVNEFISFL